MNTHKRKKMMRMEMYLASKQQEKTAEIVQPVAIIEPVQKNETVVDLPKETTGEVKVDEKVVTKKKKTAAKEEEIKPQ